MDWESFYKNYRKPDYIPGYELLSKLGGGVFGVVFKARKRSIGKFYAVKFLKVEDEKVKEAILRELESVRYFAQIDHPNLVSIEDKGEVDGIPFIVMGYAGDETLKKRLESGALSAAETIRIFRQVCEGVQALHEKSIVHFDLKPGNVFLRGGIARVGDYGLSRLMSESRNTLSFGRGTPYYMAPEMLRKKGDKRSDVYSLGIILYECLTGEVPFRGESEWEVLKKHETEEVRFPKQVDRGFREVIRHCLAKRPEDRFASVRDLLGALESGIAPTASTAAAASRAATRSIPRTCCKPFERFAPGRASGTIPARLSAPFLGTVGLFFDRAMTALRQGDDFVEGFGKPGGPHPVPRRPFTPTRAVYRRFEEGALVGNLFRLAGTAIELTILCVVVPLKFAFVLFGRLLDSLIHLPFRLLGLAVKLVAVVIGFFFLFLFLRLSFQLLAGMM